MRGTRTVWNTGSQSFSYLWLSSTSSFVNFTFSGGGIAAKRVTGADATAPSLATSSSVKSGESRSLAGRGLRLLVLLILPLPRQRSLLVQDCNRQLDGGVGSQVPLRSRSPGQ